MEKNRKIVLIDDDVDFLEELQTLLELSGYETVAVTDEEMAVEIVRNTRPAMVFLDLKMPKKTGFQIAEEIRRCPEVWHVPIIAMSAYYKGVYKGLLSSCGIDNCLTKPFQPLDVIAEIERVFDKNNIAFEAA